MYIAPLQTPFNSIFLDEKAQPSGQYVLPKLVGVDLSQIVEDASRKVNKLFDQVEPFIYKSSKFC